MGFRSWLGNQFYRAAARLGSVTVQVDDSPGWVGMSGLPNERDAAEIIQLYNDALLAWRKNPLARKIVDITTSHVLGTGLTMTSPNAEFDKFLQAFWHHRKNNMRHRLANMSEELSRAGDLFPVLFRNEHDGMSYVRFLVKPQIERIVTAENDWEQEIAFVQRPYAAGEEGREWLSPLHPESMKAEAVATHYAINRPMGSLLGEGDLDVMLPWLLRYSRLLEGRVRLNEAARSFLWFLRVGRGDVKKKQEQYKSVPAPGSLVVHEAGEEWEVKAPSLNAVDARHDLSAVVNMVAAGSYPPNWLGQSGSSNLAEAKAMQGPAEMMLKRRQSFFVWLCQDLVYTAYQRQVKKVDVSADFNELFSVNKSDINTGDNTKLSQSAYQISLAYAQLVKQSEIKSRTLLDVMLRNMFRFMGEPQVESTITKIVDEVMIGLDKVVEDGG